MPTLFFSLYGFGAVFITCELCQRKTNSYEEFNDIIDQFKWYLFPTKIQQILPTILLEVQQPVHIECFGSIACNRETFKRVKKLVKIFNHRNSNDIIYIGGSRWLFMVYATSSNS